MSWDKQYEVFERKIVIGRKEQRIINNIAYNKNVTADAVLSAIIQYGMDKTREDAYGSTKISNDAEAFQTYIR